MITQSVYGPVRLLHAYHASVGDHRGKKRHSRGYGTAFVDGSGPAIDESSPFFLASMTKLHTVVAVECGLVTLDTNMSTIISDFSNFKVLKFDGGKPVLRRATRNVTLSNLLTHSSGLAARDSSPALQECKSGEG